MTKFSAVTLPLLVCSLVEYSRVSYFAVSYYWWNRWKIITLLKVQCSRECTGAKNPCNKFPVYFVPGIQLSTCMMNIKIVQIVCCIVQVSKTGTYFEANQNCVLKQITFTLLQNDWRDHKHDWWDHKQTWPAQIGIATCGHVKIVNLIWKQNKINACMYVLRFFLFKIVLSLVKLWGGPGWSCYTARFQQSGKLHINDSTINSSKTFHLHSWRNQRHSLIQI